MRLAPVLAFAAAVTALSPFGTVAGPGRAGHSHSGHDHARKRPTAAPAIRPRAAASSRSS